MMNFKQARNMFFRFQKGVWLLLSAFWGLAALLVGGTGLLNKDISNPTKPVTMTPETMEAAKYVTIYGLLGTGIIILSLVIWLTFFTKRTKHDDAIQAQKINVTSVPDTTLQDKGEQ